MVQKKRSKSKQGTAPPSEETLVTNQSPPKPLTASEEATQDARRMLAMYRVAVVNNLHPYEMIGHLRENIVIDADKAKDMRRAGKGCVRSTGEIIIDELMTRGAREFGVFIEGLKKQRINLLSDLLEEKHESNLINILEPASKMLGHHWKRLSFELGTEGFVSKVETRYSRIREQALYSLIIWEDSSGIAATERRLIDGLQAIEMKWALRLIKQLSNPKSIKKKKGKRKPSKKKK